MIIFPATASVAQMEEQPLPHQRVIHSVPQKQKKKQKKTQKLTATSLGLRQ